MSNPKESYYVMKVFKGNINENATDIYFSIIGKDGECPLFALEIEHAARYNTPFEVENAFYNYRNGLDSLGLNFQAIKVEHFIKTTVEMTRK